MTENANTFICPYCRCGEDHDKQTIAFGYFYSEGLKAIEENAPIPLNFSRNVVNIGFEQGKSAITFRKSGVYKVTYGALFSSQGLFGGIKLVVNCSSTVAGSKLNLLDDSGELSGDLLLAVHAGDTLEIRATPSDITLSPVGVNAFLDVLRIAPLQGCRD